MFYKKLFGILAVAGLILVLALSACGGSTPTPTPVVLEEIDPSDAMDAPFDFYEGETRNISPFIFRVFEIQGNQYVEICRIGLFEKFKYTGPITNGLYLAETSKECSGWVDFSWGSFLVE